MPKFNGLVLTDQGHDLLLKSLEHGIPTPITRIAVGDGELSPVTPFYRVTSLVHEVQSSAQLRKKTIDNRVVQLEFTLRTADMEEGFWFREVGVFAEHPALGEILYAYENVGSMADFMPTFGGATVVSRTIRAMVQVGNAETVRINVANLGTIMFHTEEHAATEGQTEFAPVDMAAENVTSVNIDGVECFDWGVVGGKVVLAEAVQADQRVWLREIFSTGTGSGGDGGGDDDPGGDPGDLGPITDVVKALEARVKALDDRSAGLKGAAYANLGTGANDAARGNHGHAGVYADLVNGRVKPEQLFAEIATVTTSRALTVDDIGKQLEVYSETAVTLTIPTDAEAAIPVLAEIEVRQEGTGAVTIAPAEGVTLHGFEEGRTLPGQYAGFVLKKRAANDWRVGGQLE